jgi:hypothetical protein
MRQLALLAALACALPLAGLSCRTTGPMNPAGLLPEEVAGWRANGALQTYDRETIFKFMDGAGEVYLQYGFRRLFVREFSRAGAPTIGAQLYDMTSPGEAFGIFSFEREDDEAGIGQGSEYAAGLLRFWKGPFFVSVSADRETPEAREAVLSLGRHIADGIPEEGELPAILQGLPPRVSPPGSPASVSLDLSETSVRYFHGHFCLATHYPIWEGNILGLGPDTDAVLASYRLGPQAARLLLVRYPDRQRAAQALEALSSGHEPPLTGEDRWATARQAGRVLIAVFEAPSSLLAEQLLERTTERVEGSSWAK